MKCLMPNTKRSAYYNECGSTWSSATNMASRGTDIKLGEGVLDLSGLCVISTGRHESRRIDNQLRGRAGRQRGPRISIHLYLKTGDASFRF